MPHVCVIPDTDTMVQFMNDKGEVIASVDAAELETYIVQARVDDPDFNPRNPLSMNAWMGRVATALTQRIGRPISLSVASIVIRNVNTIMDDLKKTLQFGKLWTSPPPTASTVLPSSLDLPPTPSGVFSQPISPDNTPLMNSANDKQQAG